MMFDRGGQALKTGKIGRVNCVRQQLLLPGERLNSSVSGSVRLTPLRERESIRIHARIDAFVQPVRWLWPGLAAYLRDGQQDATVATWPTVSIPTHPGYSMSDLGIGGDEDGIDYLSVFKLAPMRVFNEWYRWPEDADITDWEVDGPKAVNLPHSFTRMQAYDGLVAADTQVAAASNTMDVRDLSELQARFRQAMQQEWIAHDRYVDLLQQVWRAQGSREVDKVPLRLAGAEIGVNPRDMYATDGDSLGSSMALYNFTVNHRFGRYVAPEHSIVTYMFVMRFSPVAEDEGNPMALVSDRDWASLNGEPQILASQRPQPVRERNISGRGTTTVLGYLPAGWHWRARWNCVGKRIDAQNTFPILRSIRGETAKSLRDATRIGEPFLSSRLGDYYCDLMFNETVDSPISGPRSSVFAGSGKEEGGGSAYPYPSPGHVV